VLAGQRIGILGANGQGKSTLVKTIARDLAPLAGTVTEGKGLSIGYFAQQELDVLRPDDNPLEHMIRLAKELGPTPVPGASRTCAASWAASTSAATWSSRPWAP
jgi:ATP-binding cassette subfamily F protein 3